MLLERPILLKPLRDHCHAGRDRPSSPFPEGRYVLNCDNTELKRSSKIFFSISERYRRAVVG